LNIENRWDRPPRPGGYSVAPADRFPSIQQEFAHMSCDTLKDNPTSVGRYDFLQLVGKGGIGSVYRARDRDSGEVVAVKVLDQQLSENPELLCRFVQEFRAATKLEHPNIVRAIESGSDGPYCYIVSEFVEGQTLGEMIATRGRLPEAEAVRIVTQVAQALHYAHVGRVIHRDVKPDNVLVRADGVAKLADFGLAKDFKDGIDLTRPAHGLGTPHFMAPEQYQDAKNVGVACDVYSLGATLYNAVTGRIPFDGCASLVALAKKVKGDIPAPRSLVPGLSDRVDEAIRRAMNPDAARRPVSCLQFFRLLAAPPRRAGRRHANGKARTLAAPSGLPADRRAWIRHPLSLGTTCTVDTAVHGGDEGQESWPLIVQDVSAGGVGLLLARRFESGTVLSIDFAPTPDAPPRSFAVRVVRVRSDGQGHWAHGCAFPAPLAEHELAMLLGDTAAMVVSPTPRRA
jgi:hypothetical protein